MFASGFGCGFVDRLIGCVYLRLFALYVGFGGLFIVGICGYAVGFCCLLLI